jgi:D-alanyl-D-alanine carboxypeptidase
MMLYRIAAFLLITVLPATAQAAQPNLRSRLQSDVSQYLATRAKAEHISAVSLSVLLPGSSSNINVTAGTTQYGGRGRPITPANLYQIGSITKSFTSATILQLEAQGRLNIDQTVGKWLPQYPAWKNISIRRLLNMTSDIPTYDDVRSMLAAYAANPTQDWTPKELIAYVYPSLDPGSGWLYSNTAYLLSQLIIERVTQNSYSNEIHRRFLNNPAIKLNATYYEPNLYPADVTNSMVSGYFFSTDPDNAGLGPIYGKDVRNFSVSWAQGAGAVVATPQDVTHWVRALYEGPILAPAQRRRMMTLVSQESGKPIRSTGERENRGFGLGVGEMYMPKMGHIWFYEGMTLGYRMTYVYLPKSHVIFAVGLNSQPDKKQDQVGRLMSQVFDRLHAAGKV